MIYHFLTLYIYYDAPYIYYTFMNDIPKDLLLHKVYLLCWSYREDNWYVLLILWKKNYFWVTSPTLRSVCQFLLTKDWNKIWVVSSFLFAIVLVNLLFLIVCLILEWTCMFTKYVNHLHRFVLTIPKAAFSAIFLRNNPPWKKMLIDDVIN